MKPLRLASLLATFCALLLSSVGLDALGATAAFNDEEVSSSITVSDDESALKEACRIARERQGRDGWPARGGPFWCAQAANDLADDLIDAALSPDSPLYGWGVRTIENGCHRANLITSPGTDPKRYYYIENNLGLACYEMNAYSDNNVMVWKPREDDTAFRKYLLRTCHMWWDLEKNIYTWRPVPVASSPEQTMSTQVAVQGSEIECPVREEPSPFPVETVTSFDPNDKVGSQGTGEEKYSPSQQAFRYAIFFENLETATAPAQEVVITDQLEMDKLDLGTLILGPISLGDIIITPPSGQSNYTTSLDLRPDNNLIVQIEAHLDPNTGLLTWRFTSLDPSTGDPPDDPLTGFLPPNVDPPKGDGTVLFTVMPKPELGTGTVICNQANIVFDTNEPIVTPEWCNTIDSSLPASMVLPLAPVQTSTEFELQWVGTDNGAGIRDYTVFVSEDGAPYLPWLTKTSATMGLFSGDNGKTYNFYSVARDKAGNTENVPEIFDATTVVTADLNHSPIARCQNVTVSADARTCGVDAVSIDNGSYDPDGDPISRSQSPTGPYGLGETSITLTVTDDSGASDSCSATVRIVDTTAPALIPPSQKSAECSSATGTTINLDVPTVSDACDSSPTVANDAPTAFPLGTSIVTWSATDTSGNVATAIQEVTVVDTVAPIVDVMVSPDTLWPPNHKMVSIAASVTAHDVCDSSPSLTLSSVTMNETDGTNAYSPDFDVSIGDGNTVGDIVIDENGNISLRAERAGTGTGRLYAISYDAKDTSGNTGSGTAIVAVPHDQ